ncbi:MAG TPA: family 78 glycoside hydrolase catalytic domain, partial [Devosia sp.]|nr:family 78 glycoside hydrolase catalytic domain [Devosia sp.]
MTEFSQGSGAQTQDFAWTARMVRPLADAGVGTRASFLRQSFHVASVADAVLRISALGLYRCFINGQRVGNDQLTPGWTCYNERLSYQTYDVASLLRQGDNTIDIWLGDGWYRSQMMWAKNPILNTWGNQIGAVAELRSGRDLLVATDATWQSGLLPILKSGIYFGEIYDAREEDLRANMGSAVIDSFAPAVLIPHEITPVQELTPLPVVHQFTDAEGRTIYDFGQNSGGYVRFTVQGQAGARVTVEHAEVLDHGSFENTNMRSAPVRLEYLLKGGDPETYTPHFTFFGFRYVRVTIEGQAAIASIVSVPITSAIAPTASFTSGNPLVNRLVENTIWSQRANFIEVPTDCPQRDERLGWTGDAQVFAPTACYLNDSHAFLVKWLRDVMADQRPDGAIAHVSPDPTRNHEDILPGFYGSTGWGDAICVVPWTLYTHYGDTAILAETLPAMVRWNDFVWSISDGPIVNPPRPWNSRGFSFGDWLQPKGPSEKPLPTIGDDAAATIYLFISSTLTAKTARVLGDIATATRMEARAAAVKAAFAHEFITASGRLAYDDQTS